MCAAILIGITQKKRCRRSSRRSKEGLQVNKDIQKAYDALVPADQLVVDAMIVALYQKDKELRNVTQEVMKLLDQKGKPES